MSKKKGPGRMNTEKDLARLMEEIQKREFKSTDELNDFMNNLLGQSLDNLPPRRDKKGRSLDLAYEAYDQPVSKGKKLIKQALELDPDNAEAYNYLASIETDIGKAMKLYEKAIKAGEKSLGKKFFKEEKGYFWGMMETRPYMRAKAGLASCFQALDELDKAIEIYEEMLELNPDDNQGIRYFLSTLLLDKDDLTKFELLLTKYGNEDCAVWNYNKALYSFKKIGRKAKTDKLLLKAYKGNKFVINYMLGIWELPEELPEYIEIGGESEAIAYVFDAWKIWANTKGALDWLYEFKMQRP